MSTQSTVNIKSKVFSDVSVVEMDKSFVSMAHRYMMESRFKVGDGYSDIMYFHLKTLHRIYTQNMCLFNSCELEDFMSVLNRFMLNGDCLKSC